MRFALVSDIHGNEIALQEVLADIDRIGVDEIVCLGDIATLGPRPRAVMQILREGGYRCIMGNHDEFLLDPDLICKYTKAPSVIDAVRWCRDEMQDDDLEYLRGLAREFVLPLGCDSSLLLFHGSPRSNTEDILATTSSVELDLLLDGRIATVMAGGHTHIQMLRQHRGSLIVNPGSVGMPFKDYAAGRTPTVLDHAEYATIDEVDGAISVTLRRLPLDRKALREAAAASAPPVRDLLASHYL